MPAAYAVHIGKPGSHINICGDTVTDYESGEDLCLPGEIDLSRCRSTHEVPSVLMRPDMFSE
jgi:hypothetical protein